MQVLNAEIFVYLLQLYLFIVVLSPQLLLFLLLGTQNSRFLHYLFLHLLSFGLNFSHSNNQCLSLLFLVVYVVIPLKDAVLLLHLQKFHPFHFVIYADLEQLEITGFSHFLLYHISQHTLLVFSLCSPPLQLLNHFMQLITLPLIEFARLSYLLLFCLYFAVYLQAFLKKDVVFL